MSMPLSLRGYRLATWAATPIAGPLLWSRLSRGKEDSERLDERRGLFTRERPRGPLIWLHGASVGESLSLLPLIERLTQSGRAALVTTGTVTSAELMARRLPSGAFHQFAPLDAPSFTRRFFAHWRPDLGLIAESELWPNMIVDAERAGVPLTMVNARMSERSFERWRRAPKFIRALLGSFDQSLAQSEGDADASRRSRRARGAGDRQPQIRRAGPAGRPSGARGAVRHGFRAADLDRRLDARRRGAHRRAGPPSPRRAVSARPDIDCAAPSFARRGDRRRIARRRVQGRAALARRTADA